MTAAAVKPVEAVAFPWEAVLHLGLSRLRLDPTVFWAMTPIEFFAAIGGMAQQRAGLDAAALSALMAAFPDAAG